MLQPKDKIRVGKISLPYSVISHGWIIPGGKVVKNPLKAQRIAEFMNSNNKML